MTYKFDTANVADAPKISVELSLNSELKQINRKTDSFFDWLGDWGGLQDGLSLLLEIILFAH